MAETAARDDPFGLDGKVAIVTGGGAAFVRYHRDCPLGPLALEIDDQHTGARARQ